jgi:hypothetical protein
VLIIISRQTVGGRYDYNSTDILLNVRLQLICLTLLCLAHSLPSSSIRRQMLFQALITQANPDIVTALNTYVFTEPFQILYSGVS